MIISHRLLILGSLGEFTELVQKARERGIYTIVCDGYPEGPARKFADESHVIPVTETERIARLCRERQIDGIITSFSDLLLECMVKIADRAGLACYLKPKQLAWYRDKAACRELLARAGLPTPGFVRLPVSAFTDGTAAAQCSRLRWPLVTKPLNRYGSRGVYISRTPDELLTNGGRTAAYTSLDEILVEEYNDGYECNMMTWVRNGVVHTISVADREKTYIAPGEIPIDSRNVYPSRLYAQVESEALAVLQTYIRYTGQRDGALSMQFFWKPGQGVEVCEIAARFFGYEHQLTDIVYHFNIEDLLLNSLYDTRALQRQLSAHRPDRPDGCGAVLYFHGKPGRTVQDLSVARELGRDPHVVLPWIFSHEGEVVEAHGANPYATLYYIRERDRESLDAVTRSFFSQMKIADPDGKNLLYPNQLPYYGDARGK